MLVCLREISLRLSGISSGYPSLMQKSAVFLLFSKDISRNIPRLVRALIAHTKKQLNWTLIGVDYIFNYRIPLS